MRNHLVFLNIFFGITIQKQFPTILVFLFLLFSRSTSFPVSLLAFPCFNDILAVFAGYQNEIFLIFTYPLYAWGMFRILGPNKA